MSELPALHPTRLFGDFEGAYIRPEEGDLLALRVIPPALLSGEAELFETKWFDYRRLHPTQATFLFMHGYRAAYRRVMARREDYRQVHLLRGMKVGNPFDPDRKETPAFWKARRLADAAGIPYEQFCYSALDYGERSCWENLPRPGQFEKPEIVDKIVADWEEVSAAYIRLPDDPIYLAKHFVGSAIQVSCHDWIMLQISKRAAPEHALGRLLPTHLQPELARETARREGWERVGDAIERVMRGGNAV